MKRDGCVTAAHGRRDVRKQASGSSEPGWLVTFFEISCEAHARGATIYVAGLFGEIIASRIERWIASLPDEMANIRLDLHGVSYIDPVSFVRVARALTAWRDAQGQRTGRRVNMEFPERSRRRNALPPLAGKPGVLGAPAPAHELGASGSTSATY